MPDNMIQPLVDSSVAYAHAKREFEITVTAARRKGWVDEEIARVTGLTVSTIETVAGKRRSGESEQ